jgi:hypothetical protein
MIQGIFTVKYEDRDWVIYGYITGIVYLVMLGTGSAALLLVKNQQVATFLMMVSFLVIISTTVIVFYKFRQSEGN